jgi:hypothetical protein
MHGSFFVEEFFFEETFYRQDIFFFAIVIDFFLSTDSGLAAALGGSDDALDRAVDCLSAGK